MRDLCSLAHVVRQCEQLACLKNENVVCLQPSLSKDGEVLRKSSQFDTRVIVLCDQNIGNLLTCSSPIVVRLDTLKLTLSLPNPIEISQ